MRTCNNLARRRFLQFLAGSPLLAYENSSLFAQERLDPDLQYILSQARETINSPDKALNVFDIEAVARQNLPPAHYGYIATGVTGEGTQIANREGYKKLQLHMRRLIDVNTVDMSVELFGEKWPSPLGIAPCGSLKAFHPLGEITVANAARTRNSLQILSTVATTSVEDVNKARGEPVWFQLYTYSNFSGIESMVRRVEAAGCPVLVITVDLSGADKRETLERFKRMDQRNCASCHGPQGYAYRMDHRPNLTGVDFQNAVGLDKLDWNVVDRLREKTRMKIIIKGIVTAEDARLCIEHGMDGIIVSNHGGRAESSNRGTIESLPEVVAAVDGKISIMLDGGIRRGADIFKALALGATKVFIGRPYLWGLGAFGQAGVERVLDILNQEFLLVMKQAGTTEIDGITKDYLV